MKKISTLLLAAAVLMTAFSCSKENEVAPENNQENEPVVFTAYPDANITTKTSLNVVAVLWSESDKVATYIQEAKVVSSNTVVSNNGKKAEFTFDSYTASDYNYLIYPDNALVENGSVVLPTEQKATENSFANGANVASASVEDPNNIKFKNLGGLLSLKINNDNIQSVELSADEVMTGAATVNVATGEVTKSESGANKVILNEGLTKGSEYYAVVYPGSYTGLKIVITDNQGRTATYSNKNTLTVGRNANLFIAELTVPDSKWKGPEWSYTFESKQFESNGEKELKDKKWTLAGDGGYWGYDGTKGQQFGSSGEPYKTLTLSSETFGDKYGIEEIVLNTSGAKSVEATVSVSVGGTQFKVDESTTQSLTATATEYRFTSADGKLHNGSIVISYAQTSSKALYLKSIVVNPGNNSGETPSEKTYSVSIDENITNGKVVASKTEGIKEGEKVQFTITPNSNYELEALTINSEDWTEFVVNNVLDFTMPAKDVTVSATFNSAGGSGETSKTSTLTFTSECNGSGTANDDVVWVVTSDGDESNFDNNRGIHYGTGKAAVQYIILSTSDISGTVTKVVVNASTASGVSATAAVTVGGSAFGGDAQSLSTTATNYTFEGSASGEIVITVSKPSSATKALYVKSVAVTYTSNN